MIIIENDSLLYEDAQGMMENVSQDLLDACKEASVLLYLQVTDAFLEDMARNADQVFLIRRIVEGITKTCGKGVFESAEEPDHPGGFHIINGHGNEMNLDG